MSTVIQNTPRYFRLYVYLPPEIITLLENPDKQNANKPPLPAALVQFSSEAELDATVLSYTSLAGKGVYSPSQMSVRTDTLKHFAQDFFFPRVIHIASKIDRLATRIFASVTLAAIDLITLPIRLITLILGYRAEFPLNKEKHPLYISLKNYFDSQHKEKSRALEDSLKNLKEFSITTLCVTNLATEPGFSLKAKKYVLSLTGEDLDRQEKLKISAKHETLDAVKQHIKLILNRTLTPKT